MNACGTQGCVECGIHDTAALKRKDRRSAGLSFLVERMTAPDMANGRTFYDLKLIPILRRDRQFFFRTAGGAHIRFRLLFSLSGEKRCRFHSFSPFSD